MSIDYTNGLAVARVKADEPAQAPTKNTGLIQSILNSIKPKEVPLNLKGGTLGIRG